MLKNYVYVNLDVNSKKNAMNKPIFYFVDVQTLSQITSIIHFERWWSLYYSANDLQLFIKLKLLVVTFTSWLIQIHAKIFEKSCVEINFWKRMKKRFTQNRRFYQFRVNKEGWPHFLYEFVQSHSDSLLSNQRYDSPLQSRIY